MLTYARSVNFFFLRCSVYLPQALTAAGLKPVAPQGGFFIIADTSAVEVPAR